MRSWIVLFCLFGLALAKHEDPEVNMTVPQIIQRWGYPSEIHEVTTKDSYILQMHRIPYGKNQQPSKGRPVAFLQHGLECSSSSWVTNLPEFSLGYMLADAGFDVWLGNSRGNLYGINSPTIDTNSHEYWKFSWDQMVKYDLDASIDYVLKETGQKYVYYAGHSQGTLIMFSKLSEDAKFASKIRQFHALAPVGTVKNVTGFLRFIADNLYFESEVMLDIFGRNQFLPEDGLIHIFAEKYCKDVIIDDACEDFLFAICGPNSHQMNVTRLPVFLVDEPSGTSTQNIIHWAQMIRTGKQQMYNYGLDVENELHYGPGHKQPPIYDITKIKTDMWLYWSPSDWLADEYDVTTQLLANLPKAYLKGVSKLTDFNHLDFIWGNRAAAEIYTPIIQTMLSDVKGRAGCEGAPGSRLVQFHFLTSMAALVLLLVVAANAAVQNCPLVAIRGIIVRATQQTKDPVTQMQMVRRVVEDIYGGTWGVLIVRNTGLVSHDVHWTIPDHANPDGTPAFCLTVVNRWQYNVFKTGSRDTPDRVSVADIVSRLRQSDEKRPPNRMTLLEFDERLAAALTKTRKKQQH